MPTSLTGENIGVKWKPVWTTSGVNRKKDPYNTSEHIYTLHLECATDCVYEVQKNFQYGMTLPLKHFLMAQKLDSFQLSTLFFSPNNRTKFVSCLAHQAALSSGLGTCKTWEMSINLWLDKKSPTGKSFCDLMMEITPENSPNTQLFHTINKQ